VRAAETAVDDERAAEWMLDQLTGAERQVLALFLTGASLREMAAALPCTVYKAGRLKERIEVKLRRLAREAGDGEGATAALLSRVEQQGALRHLGDEDEEADAD